jgi:hypothetical protein
LFGQHARVIVDLAPWKFVVLAALIVLSVILYRTTFPPVSRPRRAALAALRAVAFVLLAALLFNPALVRRTTEVRRPLVVALLDVSRSMAIVERGQTRLAAAVESAGRFGEALHGRTDARLEIVPFSSTLAAAPVRPDTVTRATGEGTDIFGAIESAERRYRSDNLQAIVVLSDGCVTRGMMTAGAGAGTPVYTAGFGDTTIGPDVSVDEVIADRTAYRGMKMPVEAAVHAVGLKGRAIRLRLLEDGTPRSTVTLAVRQDAEMLSATFDYVPAVEGDHRLTVEALPAPGEGRTENSAESIRVHVFKERIRILYVDQFPDWNMTFVRDLVARSKRFVLETVGWTPAKGWAVMPGEASWSPPAAASELAGYDLVVISDDLRLFGVRRGAEMIDAYVKEGGSLLLLADESSPAAKEGSLELIEQALPVRRARPPRIELGDGFVAVSPEGFTDPVASALSAEVRLDVLPPLPGRISGLEPVPGARVPLVLKVGSETVPFLVVGRTGSGLSGIVLGFPLWRWRLAGADGEKAYDSFVGGLIQYMAEGARAPGLEIDSDRTVYRIGDRIGLSVYVGGNRLPEGIRGEVRRKGAAQAARPGGATGAATAPAGAVVASFPFEPDPRRRGYFKAELEPLPAGDYIIVASETGTGGLSGSTEIAVLPTSVELLAPVRDTSLLERIAETTGGAYVDGPALARIVPRLRLSDETIEHADVRELRRSILAFVAVVALFAMEWVLRKAWGLV